MKVVLCRAQLRDIDRLAVERYHIPSVVLMENAARGATDVARDMLGGNPAGKPVLILCGGGNNGGDGLAIARHLHNRGAVVTIALATDPARFAGDALINWQIVTAMQLPSVPFTEPLLSDARPVLVIDAIFGTGLDRPPREPFPAIADAVNRSHIPVLAIDVPSGLDCETGSPPGACIRAARTVTFVAPKPGFAAAGEWTGPVTVADIGCPIELIETARPLHSLGT